MSDAILIIWFGIVVILLGVFMRLRIALVVYGVLVILIGLSRLRPRL